MALGAAGRLIGLLPVLPCVPSWGLFPVPFICERRFSEYIIVNASTAALLDLFQIDRQAMDAARGFYQGRHPGAYAAGLWSEIADYEAPDCPQGYETFRGYLARTEPEMVRFMDHVAGADDAEEAALTGLCRAAGLEAQLVAAPAWLAREGVFDAMAFPVSVLKAYAAVAAA